MHISRQARQAPLDRTRMRCLLAPALLTAAAAAAAAGSSCYLLPRPRLTRLQPARLPVKGGVDLVNTTSGLRRRRSLLALVVITVAACIVGCHVRLRDPNPACHKVRVVDLQGERSGAESA